MTKKEITDRILDIVCNKFKIEKKKITSETTLDRFGVNSFYLYEAIIDIEDDFKINIFDEFTYEFYAIPLIKIADFVAAIGNYVEVVINKNK